jgi:hypothetical protein
LLVGVISVEELVDIVEVVVVVVVSLTFGVDENCVLSANTPVRSLV